ncbi:glycoside hydrolase family 43 protein [Cellulomonas aerilata]|uniref:Endo-1,4-beta-xylanase n=1 Tax=Cellulomonas aerilata TaxID=515326 RepID=A0A512DI10_9CELL|nr:glycoside hydrolase family 43 protein [Cellulomonas aerilata]GEO35850.1 endo-1,4-beta-xylanase [Cellulomonas aerilata]
MSSVGREHAPVHPGYFADPFVLRTGSGYVAYGTFPPDAPERADWDGLEFRVLTSPDLEHWTDHGGALVPLPVENGTDYWAPEVAEVDGTFYLYYSVGHGHRTHHLRVATSDTATGPFHDAGVDLTPDALFAIDPHPFRDDDGSWYLYYAHDVLEGDRVGTMLAVDRLVSMTEVAGQPTTILRPDADWQIYLRDREMYGRRYDWHTLEGPFVRRRGDRYFCFHSGGNWENETYGVAWAEADHPLGPWALPDGARRVLYTVENWAIGPGHNSVTTDLDDQDAIVYHAWDDERVRRRMYVSPLTWEDDGPHVPGF